MKNLKTIFGKTILIAFLALLLTGTVSATEWTVGGASPDFLTVQEAVAAGKTVDGDVLLVRAGTYTFTANLSISKSITIAGASNETVIFDLGGFTFIPRKEDFAVSDVTFKNGSYGINLQVNATNARIENCTFDGMTHKDGIRLVKDDAVFINNTVKNMDGFTNALYVGADNVKIIGNVFDGLTGSGSAARIICVESSGAVEIRDNQITNNAGEAIRLWKEETANAVITGNIISGNTLKGIYLYNAGENNAVYLNDIFSNAGGNVASYGTLPAAVLFNNPAKLTSSLNGNIWTGNHGNYWGGDYTGTDTNGNGIGTTQKTILSKYADENPLTVSVSQFVFEEAETDPDDPDDPDNPEPGSGSKKSTSLPMTTHITPSVSVTFSIDSLDFGDLSAGQTSQPLDMQITNTGGCVIKVTAEVTDNSDDLYKQGIWIDNALWPDFSKIIQKGETATSTIVLKVPENYAATGTIQGTLMIWIEAV